MPPPCSSNTGGPPEEQRWPVRPGREEGDAGKGPQPRPQAERSRGDRPRWALRSVRHRVTDRRAAEQPETRAGNEGQETAASEEEERHRGRLPRKATPVFPTLNTAEWLLSLSKGLFTP